MRHCSSITTCAFLGAALFSAVPAAGQHLGDVGLAVENQTILTGSFDDQSNFSPFRVFGSEFGEGGIFNFTDEPGFDAEAGTFTPGSQTGFNILAPLLVWNGSGFEPTGGETLTINFSSLVRTTGSGFVSGFGLTVPSNGSWHRHLGFTLNADGQGVRDPGIYLLELELWNTDGLTNSEPFWIVFNFQQDEAVHDAAIDWLVDSLSESEPATIVSAMVIFGSHLGGTIADLTESDNSFYRTRSKPGFSAIEPELMQLVIGLETSTGSPATFDLTVESRINNPNGTATFRLRNWQTNLFETVAIRPVGFTESTEFIEAIDATGHVRAADGRIDLLIKHVVPAVFSAIGFDSSFDQVELVVND